MNKARAIEALGGPTPASQVIGITPQAIYGWPDELPPRLADRVIAALVRQGKPVPPELIPPPQPAQAA